MNARRGWGAAMIAAAGLAAAPLTGQQAGGGAEFQVFRFGDADAVGIRSLSLVTVPFAVGASLGSRVSVEAHGAFASGRLERPGGGAVTLTGPTDTAVRVRFDALDGLVLSGLVLLPTGTDGHDAEEAELAGAVAADLLPFRISNWGSGGGGGVSALYVRSFGRMGAGVDVAYVRSGEFDLGAGTDLAYRPGDSFRVVAALDRLVGPAGKLTLRLSAQRFGDDAIEGENLFRSGDRLEATGSYSFAVGPGGTGAVYAGYRHRGSGAFLTELETRPSQGMLVLGGGLRTPALGGTLVPSVDLRALRREDGVGQGYGIGVGGHGEWAAGSATLMPTLRLRTGSVVVREGLRTGFTGLDAGVRVRWGRRR